MATTDLGACEWFVWNLQRSNLIDRGQLDQVVGEFLKKQPRAEPTALAQYLVGEGILSQFQADRLLQDKAQNLVLGPYVLMDALGAGSMGTVYKAQSKNDGNWYAVKVLPRRSMWNVRIARRQVRSFEQCRHVSVVPFVDVGTAGGTHYLAWPLVEGTTLEALVQERRQLEPNLAALYALQTAEGLALCHENNLIHGLIKPSNLMIGADNQIRILDFGIGTLLAESEGESMVDTMSTANTMTSGLDCASPESIMEPTNRTPAGDQYSLGCVLYYCLTGRYPFPEGTAVEKMMAHQTQQPPSIKELRPDVPDDLIAVVDRLMQKAPEARYDRTAEAVEALRQYLDAHPTRAARPSAADSARRGESARRGSPDPADQAPAPKSSSRLSPALEARMANGHSSTRLPPSSRSSTRLPPTPSADDAPKSRPAPLPPAIPSRDSLRGGKAPAPPAAASRPAKAESPSSGFMGRGPSPAATPDDGPSGTVEDRLGKWGMLLLLILTAALTALITNVVNTYLK